MATNQELEQLYGKLRANVLARHFALGRFWRADHFSNWNYLGLRSNDSAQAPCSAQGEHQRADLYTGAQDLLQKEAAAAFQVLVSFGGSAAKRKLRQLKRERWRVVRHRRENPLLMAGMRLGQLAIEHHLGAPSALPVIRRVLDRLALLYKVRDSSSPFAGYIIRYDAGTCDDWQVELDEEGRQVPRRCCDFLTNPDPRAYKDRPYLYCTPLDDPRYRNASLQEQRTLRLHEPSMDELTGLVYGYSMLFRFLKEDSGAETRAVVSEVQRQARNLGRYLAANGYLLVRPCGGFSSRGASGINPCLEFVIDRALGPVAGESFASRATFAQAMDNAGLGACLGAALQPPRPEAIAGMVARIVTALRPGGGGLDAVKRELLQTFTPDFIRTVGPQFLDELIKGLSGSRLAGTRAVTRLVQELTIAQEVWRQRSCFDVPYDDMRSEFALASLIMGSPLPPRERYMMYMRQRLEGWSEFFKAFHALAVLDDADTTVRDAYLGWYRQHYQGFTFEQIEEVDEPGPRGATALLPAVAALLASDEADERKLARVLDRSWGRLQQAKLADLVLCERSQSPDRVIEAQDKHFDNDSSIWIGGYMTCLSLAWLHARRKRNRGVAVPSWFPDVPTAPQSWPSPTIPADVVAAARDGELALPLDALQNAPLPGVIPTAGLELFSDAPKPPVDPNVLMPSRRPVVGRTRDARLALYASGSDDRVWTVAQEAPNQGWGAWEVLGLEQRVRRLALASAADGRPELFGLAEDGRLFHLPQDAQDTWGSWALVGESFRDLAAARDSEGRMRLFGLREATHGSEAGAVWQRVRQGPPGGWSEWLKLGLQGASQLVPGTHRDGRLQLFALVEGRVWHRWQTPGTGEWSRTGWQALGETQPLRQLAVGSNEDGRLEVFAVGRNLTPYHIWQQQPDAVGTRPTQTGWSAWEALGQNRAVRQVEVGRNADGRLEVFALGTDGTLVSIRQVAPNQGWDGWTRLGERGPEGRIARLTVGTNQDGRLEVFVLCTSGQAWHLYQLRRSAPEWSHWERL